MNPDGSFAFKTAPDFENPTSVGGGNEYQFNVRADNGVDPAEDHLITVDVTDATEILETNFQQRENTTEPLVIETGANETPFTYTLLDGLDRDAFTVNPDGSFAFNTAPDFENPTSVGGGNEYQFNVRADNGVDPAEEHTITVNVTNETEIVQTSLQQQENTTAPLFLENNVGEIPFTYTLLDGLDKDAFTVNSDGSFAFNTAPDFENPTSVGGGNAYQFNVRADNGVDPVEEHTITVNVANLSEIVETTFQQVENRTDSFFLETSEGEDAFTYTVIGGADRDAITLNSDTGEFHLNTAPNFETRTDTNRDGVFEFIVKATTTSDYEVTEKIKIAVENDVETVVAVDDSVVVNNGGIAQVDVVANDLIGALDHLDLVEVTSVTNGTASLNESGQIEFIHDGTSTTSAEVTYRIVNEEGNSSSAKIDIVVNPTSLASTANDNLELSSLRTSAFSIADTIVANDFEGSSELTSFKVQIVDGPSQGTVVVRGENLIFTPVSSFAGTDSFSYQLVSLDGQQVLSEVAAVSVELATPTPNPQAPDANLVPVDNNSTPALVTEGAGLNRPATTSDDETPDAIPQPVVATIDAITTQQGYVAPIDFDSGDDRVNLALEFEGNVYSYFGRTQFLELANLELSEVQVRDSVQGESSQSNQLLLSQLIVGVSNMDSSDGDDASALSVGKLIFQNAPLITVTAISVVSITMGLTLTGSQIHRILDVGSLLDDDESIEDIISS